MGAQKNRLIETVLLSTHNILFWLRNKNIINLFFCYALLRIFLLRIDFLISKPKHVLLVLKRKHRLWVLIRTVSMRPKTYVKTDVLD